MSTRCWAAIANVAITLFSARPLPSGVESAEAANVRGASATGGGGVRRGA